VTAEGVTGERTSDDQTPVLWPAKLALRLGVGVIRVFLAVDEIRRWIAVPVQAIASLVAVQLCIARLTRAGRDAHAIEAYIALWAVLVRRARTLAALVLDASTSLFALRISPAGLVATKQAARTVEGKGQPRNQEVVSDCNKRHLLALTGLDRKANRFAVYPSKAQAVLTKADVDKRTRYVVVWPAATTAATSAIRTVLPRLPFQVIFHILSDNVQVELKLEDVLAGTRLVEKTHGTLDPGFGLGPQAYAYDRVGSGVLR